MNGIASIRVAGIAALKVAAIATMLLLPAATSHAQHASGRGGNGNHAQGGGGRAYGGGGHAYGGGGRANGGGGHAYGGERRFVGGGGHSFVGGGWSYGGPRYRRPFGYRYIRPHNYIHFGIGFGVPYYYHPRVYGYAVEPEQVYVDPGDDFDVTNRPPAGCYYYDPFCDERFSTLDDYTDHLQDHEHSRTVEIVDEQSGGKLRTLEYVDGEWGVRH